MSTISYDQFIAMVKQYKILPFASFIPEYPSLSEMTTENDWHSESETDPWQWRIRIVYDGIAAYGKFFNDKLCFIHVDYFPVVRAILCLDRTMEERYHDGLLSKSGYNVFKVLEEQGSMDSRHLRKAVGLHTKETKKEYEKALIELQNYGDIVITGTSKKDNDEKSWSSMCYQTTDDWLASMNRESINISSEVAKQRLVEEILQGCSEKANKFFVKKLRMH